MSIKKTDKKVVKTEKKAVVPAAPAKVEWITIFKTTYFRWRYWVKDLLITGKVKKYRFIKEEVGYNGSIAVDKSEVEAAKKVLNEYKTKNPDIKEMWW